MQTLREQLLGTTRKLHELGLNKGTSGNVSVRDDNGFLVTPSGMEVEAMTPHDMVAMDFDGQQRTKNTSDRTPSSEWRFHRDILAERPEINAVIHAHSMFATTMACLHKEIPAFHYMIAVTGGNSLRCAPYALFGSQELSDHALKALQERRACLLANHGMIAVGETLNEALDIAVEVENLCEQYWRALLIGQPHVLSEQEMAQVFQSFKGYGKWARQDKH
jgi:L-fuculose-phosphate aldolase